MKIFYFSLSCLVMLLITSCSNLTRTIVPTEKDKVSVVVTVTTEPHLYLNNQGVGYKILGEVVNENKTLIGYTEFLKIARDLYPECDYVIDIMVDQKTTKTVTTVNNHVTQTEVLTWVIRGTAVEYKR